MRADPPSKKLLEERINRNILFLHFMKVDTREKITTSCGGRAWLLFNLLAGIAAWEVIFMGVLRFVQRLP